MMFEYFFSDFSSSSRIFKNLFVLIFCLIMLVRRTFRLIALEIYIMHLFYVYNMFVIYFLYRVFEKEGVSLFIMITNSFSIACKVFDLRIFFLLSPILCYKLIYLLSWKNCNYSTIITIFLIIRFLIC